MKTIAIKGTVIPMFITWLCFIFLIPNNVIAQDNQGNNGNTVSLERAKEVRHSKMVSTLTEDQRAKIKDLRLEHIKAIRLLKAENGEMAAHLKTLKLAENPDNKAIFKTIDGMMTKRGEIMKRIVSYKEAFKAILTPEQIKELQIRELNRHSGMAEKNHYKG